LFRLPLIGYGLQGRRFARRGQHQAATWQWESVEPMVLTWILGFALLGSVGAIGGAALFLLFPKQIRERLVPFLVSYATGTLLGAALLGLLPEAIEQGGVLLSEEVNLFTSSPSQDIEIFISPTREPRMAPWKLCEVNLLTEGRPEVNLFTKTRMACTFVDCCLISSMVRARTCQFGGLCQHCLNARHIGGCAGKLFAF
jgi:hypothetical protein